MLILIKTNSRPINVFGPPLPFAWLNNLQVVARESKDTVIVETKEIVSKLRKKDYPHGIKFADFFEEQCNSKTKNFIFSRDDVIEIPGN